MEKRLGNTIISVVIMDGTSRFEPNSTFFRQDFANPLISRFGPDKVLTFLSLAMHSRLPNTTLLDGE
jgi:hypothetical protein